MGWEHVGKAGATMAGLLFGAAWWIFIDACAKTNNHDEGPVAFSDALPMTGATIAFFLLVTFNWAYLDAEDYEFTGNCKNIAAMSRCLLFVIVLLGFGSIIGSALVLIQKWANRYAFYGIMQLVATILIFMSAIVWRTGRNINSSSSW